MQIARGLLGEEPRSALDVGCGAGFLGSLGFTNVIGLDVRITNAVTVRASAGHLPFRAGIFDLVFAGEVLEHLNQPRRALDDWIRVLQPKGILGLSTPNGRLIRLEGNHPEHKHLFTAKGLTNYLRRKGIRHIKVRTIYFGMLSGRGLFRFIPSRTLKLFIMRLNVPPALSYDLFLAGTKNLDDSRVRPLRAQQHTKVGS